MPDSARQFGRAIIMPNLKPPVTTTAQALAYRDRILAAVPAGVDFEPLMTLYLTDSLPPDEIGRAADAGIVALKLYPAGATTNSDAGVTDLRKTWPTLEAMQRAGMPLLVHGEVTDPEIDLFDREKAFIDQKLEPLRRDFPELKIVFEHITTREAAQYVADAGATARRDDHRAPPAVQPQCDLSRRHPAALLLPAGAQARDAPAGAGRCGDLGQRPILSRHRQRAACGAAEGTRHRLRRLLYRAVARSSCMRRPSSRPARSTGWKPSPASTARLSTACRATAAHVTLQPRAVDGARDRCRSATPN